MGRSAHAATEMPSRGSCPEATNSGASRETLIVIGWILRPLGHDRIEIGAGAMTPVDRSPKCLHDGGRIARTRVDGSERNGAT